MKVFTRVAGLVVLGAVLLIGPTSSPAATPAAGTIGPAPGSTVSWTGGPYVVPQPVPDGCPPPSPLCDHFSLTVNVPASYWDTHTGGADIQITWGSPDDDFDLYVYDNSGNVVGQSAAGGTTTERVFLEGANSGQSPYEVRVVPFLAAAATYSGSATFVSQDGGPAPNPPRTTGGLAFAPPTTIVDAQRTEGEPLNYIDRFGHYWDSGPVRVQHRPVVGPPVDRRRRPVQHRQLRRPAAERAAGRRRHRRGRRRPGRRVLRRPRGPCRAQLRGVTGRRQQLDHEPGLCRGHGRRPPVVRARQRLDRSGHRQHGLPCVPADAAWLVHLFHARARPTRAAESLT